MELTSTGQSPNQSQMDVHKEKRDFEQNERTMAFQCEFSPNVPDIYGQILEKLESKKSIYKNKSQVLALHQFYLKKRLNMADAIEAGSKGSFKWTVANKTTPDIYEFLILEFNKTKDIRIYLRPTAKMLSFDTYSSIKLFNEIIEAIVHNPGSQANKSPIKTKRRIVCDECSMSGVDVYFEQVDINFGPTNDLQECNNGHTLKRKHKTIAPSQPFYLADFLKTGINNIPKQRFSEIRQSIINGDIEEGEQLWLNRDAETNPWNPIVRIQQYAHVGIYAGARDGIHEIVHVKKNSGCCQGIMKGTIAKENIDDVIKPHHKVFLGHEIPENTASANIRSKIRDRAIACSEPPKLVFDYDQKNNCEGFANLLVMPYCAKKPIGAQEANCCVKALCCFINCFKCRSMENKLPVQIEKRLKAKNLMPKLDDFGHMNVPITEEKNKTFNPKLEVFKYKERKKKALEKINKSGPENPEHAETKHFTYSPANSYVKRSLIKQDYEASKQQDDLTLGGFYSLAEASQKAQDMTTLENLWDEDGELLCQASDIESIRPQSRVLLLRASAGIGKTAFTEYALYKFCSGDFWKHFELVLLLTCRSVIRWEDQSIEEVILRSCFSHLKGSQRDAMLAYLEYLSSVNKLCLIMDGADELDKGSKLFELLFEHQSLGGAHILITGRPFSIEQVMTYLKLGVKEAGQQSRRAIAFSVIDLMGLKKDQVVTYFHNLLQCQGMDCEKQCKNLYNQLEYNIIIKNLISIPVYANIYCLCAKHFSDKTPVNLVSLFVQFLIGQIRDHFIGINSEKIERWFADVKLKHFDIIVMFRSLAELAYHSLENGLIENLTGESEHSLESPDDYQLTIEGVPFPSRNLLNKTGFFWTEIARTGLVTGNFCHLQWMEFLAAIHIILRSSTSSFLRWFRKGRLTSFSTQSKERKRYYLSFGCGLTSKKNDFAHQLIKVLAEDGTSLPTPNELLNDHFSMMEDSSQIEAEGLFKDQEFLLGLFDCATLALAVYEAQINVSITRLPALQDCSILLRGGNAAYNSLELQAFIYLVATHGTALNIDVIEVREGSSHLLETLGLLDKWIDNQKWTPKIKVGKLAVKKSARQINSAVMEGLRRIIEVSAIEIEDLTIQQGSCPLLELIKRRNWTPKLKIRELKVRKSKIINKLVVEVLKLVIDVSSIDIDYTVVGQGGPTILELVKRQWTSNIQIGDLTLIGIEDGVNENVAEALKKLIHFDKLKFDKRTELLASSSALFPMNSETATILANLASTTCTQLFIENIKLGNIHCQILKEIRRCDATHKVEYLSLYNTNLTQVDMEAVSLPIEQVRMSKAILTKEQVLCMLKAIINCSNKSLENLLLGGAQVSDGDWMDYDINDLLTQCKEKWGDKYIKK